MQPEDFVYENVKTGAMDKGADKHSAEDCAAIARQKYKRNEFSKTSKLIEDQIKQAVKQSKQKNKGVGK